MTSLKKKKKKASFALTRLPVNFTQPLFLGLLWSALSPPYYFCMFQLFWLLPVWGQIHREHCQALQLQLWRGELIFGWGEQIGGRQSSTAIRAVEEAKCACGRRSTQMTAPGGQQFPSAGASARWSLVCWVWLIWHISDGRWTTHLDMAVPGD